MDYQTITYDPNSKLNKRFNESSNQNNVPTKPTPWNLNSVSTVFHTYIPHHDLDYMHFT